MSTKSLLESIADPLRLRLLRALSERGGVSLQELAAAVEAHVNTIRPHVMDLEEAGMVARDSPSPEGRGRPRVRYRLADGWRLPTTDFHGLAELLSALVLRLGPPSDDLDALGRAWGRYLIGRPGDHDLATELARGMEQLGFHAHLDDAGVRLSGCPCPTVMPGRPDVLCRLATATIDGMLEAGGSELKVIDTRHDPERRRCTARLGTTKARPGARQREEITRGSKHRPGKTS